MDRRKAVMVLGAMAWWSGLAMPGRSEGLEGCIHSVVLRATEETVVCVVCDKHYRPAEPVQGGANFCRDGYPEAH